MTRFLVEYFCVFININKRYTYINCFDSLHIQLIKYIFPLRLYKTLYNLIICTSFKKIQIMFIDLHLILQILSILILYHIMLLKLYEIKLKHI